MEKILYTGATSGIAQQVIKKIKNKYYIYLGVHTKKQLEIQKEKYKNELYIKVIKLDLLNNNDIKKVKDLDVDILICNAAVGYGGSIAEISIDKLRENFEVNVFKTIELIQTVLKKMIKKDKGKIIIISSLAGIMPIKFIGAYSATKASIIKLTQTLYKEMKLITKNIHISLILPGMYHTGFNQVMLENKYEWMTKNSYFEDELNLIRKNETIFWNLFERKKLNTITKQIIKSIKNNNKFTYTAPISQTLVAIIISSHFFMK